MTDAASPYRAPGFEFPTDEAFARGLDESDPLAPFRDRFHLPAAGDGGAPLAYLCGNSLGLQPRAARADVDREMDDWARLAVDGHFRAAHPWYPYHQPFRAPMAAVVGAEPDEVAVMNGLTVNLHLMMASFYRPTRTRYRILIEEHAFPSDLYAVRTQARWHGFDPDDAVRVVRAREGEATLRTDAIEAAIDRDGDSIALVFFGGVQYFTGQCFDMERIAAAARKRGCRVGFNLAHAAGNVPMRLHDWEVDFAVWCGYKYLNAGPGAVAGCFVHARHGADSGLVRLAGWWGDDPDSRFRMHEKRQFDPAPGADGWQVSNPPILSTAPLRSSLSLFAEAGMEALREKSVYLTGYLHSWLARLPAARFRVLTPADPDARGCQLSLRILTRPREVYDALRADRFVVDFREPDVIRMAPVPFFNRFEEVWRLGRALDRRFGGSGGDGGR